jgi:hypothetical protein
LILAATHNCHAFAFLRSRELAEASIDATAGADFRALDRASDQLPKNVL